MVEVVEIVVCAQEKMVNSYKNFWLLKFVLMLSVVFAEHTAEGPPGIKTLIKIKYKCPDEYEDE
ncbi:hypothetical protein TorRG33x02_013090 [Trema orientale]|uniref:Uncharacterized protein n=1 Tax=Trema orientale TaxID=63057 RepID=A0A2P5FZL7_TREOI|nr:hypothetical protein TorRG33x02_013090 [Trema orientale]